MDLRAKQIHAPKNWATFEDLCHALFKVVWKDPLAQKNGRAGQPQRGVDVFGGRAGDRTRYEGVQCKGKNAHYGARATLDELLAEVAKADGFKPALKHWIYATTAPVDVELQTAARLLSVDRAKTGKFTIDVLGWDEIQALMAEAPSVVREFYPEAAYDLPAFLEAVSALQSSAATAPAAWRPITFEGARDLGPALLGRPLGPADAAVCPRLVEADVLVAQLDAAYSARIVGDPGAGKSVCAYQAAQTFAQKGASVYRLEDARAADVELALAVSRPGAALFLIDDAHLMSPGLLAHLEASTGAQTRLLSIHNAVSREGGARGAVVLDAKRAVKTIAQGLRSNRLRTLVAVRKADGDVGERMMDTRLEQRIDEAEAAAHYPWQFCFILGGGWRRAKQAVDRARAAKADEVLAAVAMRQILSRDARVASSEITSLCADAGLGAASLSGTLNWLTSERLLLSLDDCRTPHQRFAAVAMHQILIAASEDERRQIYALAAQLLTDPAYPLLGVRNLLHEFRFGHGDHRWAWARPFDAETIRAIADRCFDADTSEMRGHAGLVLTELSSFSDAWAPEIIEPKLGILAGWMSAPELGGYGLGYLHNHLWSEHKSLQLDLTSRIDPGALALAFSHASHEEIYGIGDLVQSARNGADEAWLVRMRSSLDREALLDRVRRWSGPEDRWLVAHTCYAASYYEEELAYTLVEAYLPSLKGFMASDPVTTFGEVRDIVMGVLGLDDPLGVHVGKFSPRARSRSIGRAMCAGLDPDFVAAKVSETRFRDFQGAGSFLVFLRKCAPRKFMAVVRSINWDQLDASTGEEWANPPHELEVMCGTLYLGGKGEEPVADFIAQNAARIESLPPRFAIMAPKVALTHLDAGKPIALVKWQHVEWRFGTVVLQLVAEERPDLMAALLEPHVLGIARSLSRENASWFRESASFLWTLRNLSPEGLTRILDAVDPVTASQGWPDALKNGGEPAKSVAVLVDASLNRDDALGTLAKGLRTRFPVASQSPEQRPPITGSHGRRRRNKARA